MLVVLVLWGVASLWILWSAQAQMRAGQADLADARDGVSASNLLDTDASTQRTLSDAGGHFAVARRKLDNPVLLPAKYVPILGRQVRAAEKVNQTAGEATTLAQNAMAEVRTLAKTPPGSGPERVELLGRLTDLVERTRTAIDDLDPGSSAALVGPLADAVDQVREKQADVSASLGRAAAVTKALQGVLAGPDTYLLVGANNAEMRSGSGMFLTVAPLQFRDGRMELGEVRQTSELAAAPKAAVSGPLAANWSWLDPGSDLRQLAMSPDFPESAEVARSFWKTAPGGGDVAGVIVVDIDGLRSLLEVVGPVEVDGVRYTADSVRHELLVEQYRRVGDDWEANKERHEQIGEVARAAFDRIEHGDWDVPDLANALVDMVQRRHLLLWSADAASEQAWVDSGVAGNLRPETVSVALANRAGNKVDPYLKTTVDATTTGGAAPTITLRYTITSSAPSTGPQYQLGPHIPGVTTGEHRAVVVVNLPGGSSKVEMTGARHFLDGADEGPTVLTAGEVDIPPGATVTVTVTAALPPGIDHLVIEPSARIPATIWTVDGHTYKTDVRRSVPVR